MPQSWKLLEGFHQHGDSAAPPDPEVFQRLRQRHAATVRFNFFKYAIVSSHILS